MARAMWSGFISFGMVTIPVQLHTATESHNVSFHLLHEKCDTRIKEQRYCPHCERKVDWDEIVKGYEYTKGQYIELTDEDFEKLPLPSKHTIDVASFVDAGEIESIFFDSTYYVAVEESGAKKPYKLLMDAMESKEVVGVATITFRNKERLCALRPVEGRLQLQTLLYEDEIKKNESEKPSSVKVSAQEKKMAETLIANLTTDFDPGKFKDKYQAALKKLIQAKLKGTEIKEVAASKPTESSNLMEALRASLEKAKGGAHRTARTKAASKRTMTKGAKTTKKKRTKRAA
jgi:DNA end-binding protein Ku